MHCEDCINDPYCHDCPLTDPKTLILTIGDPFPNQLGDLNLDNSLDILDIIAIQNLILGITELTYSSLNSYLSDLNQDNTTNILDIIATVNRILNP